MELGAREERVEAGAALMLLHVVRLIGLFGLEPHIMPAPELPASARACTQIAPSRQPHVGQRSSRQGGFNGLGLVQPVAQKNASLAQVGHVSTSCCHPPSGGAPKAALKPAPAERRSDAPPMRSEWEESKLSASLSLLSSPGTCSP